MFTTGNRGYVGLDEEDRDLIESYVTDEADPDEVARILGRRVIASVSAATPPLDKDLRW
jgi:hypothetical protein